MPSNFAMQCATEIIRDEAAFIANGASPQRSVELAAETIDKWINIPETDDFFKGIVLEAEHQRQRWHSNYDEGKEWSDWFWLIGYLAGKCLTACILGDKDKALHHTISAAAALANWHRAIKGKIDMRPGIKEPKV